MRAELLIDAKCSLAEGIQWRKDQQRLWWTDIHGCELWSSDEFGERIERHETPERLGAFAFDPNGHLLCAFESGLFRWDLNGDRLDRLTDFEPVHPTSRMNDGRCDRQGRFIVGGMDENELKHTSSVIQYASGHAETILTQVGCSNSICFSPDGRWMYFTDTPTGKIKRFAYDPGDGKLGDEKIFYVDVAGNGFPDGSCVDNDGALWNARFNGGSVHQVLPDGSAGKRVSVDAPQVTCACFGGTNLDRLFITTARENMSEQDLAAYPLSGGIFVAAPNAVGLPETRFAEPLFPD
ncbi:MAG: SMP-30/gluconolactonase/LRE family protein [Pseudomonadota bacterium]